MHAGVLPPSWGAMPSLLKINISRNNLTGAQPEQRCRRRSGFGLQSGWKTKLAVGWREPSGPAREASVLCRAIAGAVGQSGEAEHPGLGGQQAWG